ncbi:MAG TPA: hypothetical protein VNN62_06300 [Methylomirabilota bacterium]|nr:hypothetical protein [Methylomirabilota bacterium]
MPFLTCLGCGEEIDISGLKEGDRSECANCASLTLELVRREGELTLRQVHRVSCPLCGQMREVPAHVKAGDAIICCDRTFRLTYEFGTYALE